MSTAFTGITAVLIIVGIIVGAYAVQYFTADVRGRISANETIKSGANRIAQYDSFFNQCASIQSAEGRIDELEGLADLMTTPFDRSVAITNVAAAKTLRHEAIRTYNADARKNYTSGQFRDSDLPFQISDTDYVKGSKKTSCGAD